MYAVRLSDNDGSHFHPDLFDEMTLACVFAERESAGEGRGAEVIEVKIGSRYGQRAAEFFQGRPVHTEAVDIRIMGPLADYLQP